MDINDIEKIQQAQRQLMRDLQEQMIDKANLTDQGRKGLLDQYTSELKEVEAAKERTIRRFDEEINYYKTQISKIKKELKV